MRKARFYIPKSVEVNVSYSLELGCYHVPDTESDEIGTEVYFDEHSEKLDVEVGDSAALLEDLKGRYMFNHGREVSDSEIESWLQQAKSDPRNADPLVIASETYRDVQRRYLADPNPDIFTGRTFCEMRLVESIDSIVFNQ